MARIFALSSFVAQGPIGLRAILPALEAFGHEVVAIPTVIYSNHAGLPHLSGPCLSVVELEKILEALEKNSALQNIAAIVTGYLPSPQHVKFACTLIQRIQKFSPHAFIICDPILGDLPKGLYVSQNAAEALRKDLLPLATLITPNFFEFSWLTGQSLHTYQDYIRAARCLACKSVLVTSVPLDAAHLATLLVEKNQVQLVKQRKLSLVPPGTGDLLSGLVTAQLALNVEPENFLGKIVGLLDEVVRSSVGFSDLQFLPTLFQHEKVPALPVETHASAEMI